MASELVILDPFKMYKPTRGGPTTRKSKLAERSRHTHALVVPNIPENSPETILPPQEEIDGVTVYRRNTMDAVPSSPEEFGVDHWEARFALRARLMADAARDVYLHSLNGKADVVQGNHFPEYALAASQVAKELGLPFVQQIHAPAAGFLDLHETRSSKIAQNHLKQMAEAALFRGGRFRIGGLDFDLAAPDHVITISDATSQLLAQTYHTFGYRNGDPITTDFTTVLNGLDDRELVDRTAHEKETKQFFKTHGIPLDDTPSIGYAGSLDDLNGIRNLLEVRDAMGEDANMRIILAGPDRGPVAEFVDRPWLHYLGSIPGADVNSLYRGVTMLAMPRLDMGAADVINPLKPAEALKQGTGLLLSDNPALRRAFPDSAVFVQAGDKRSLRSALETIAQEGYPAEKLAAAQSALDRLPLWQDSADQYDDVFSAVVIESKFK